MENMWVLVANGSEARVFNLTKRSDGLKLVSEHLHPASRMKGEKLASDRPGTYMEDSSSMSTGSAYEEPMSPKEYEIDRFAHELAGTLNSGRTANSYGKLTIVAPPAFRGLLNKHMNDQVKKLITQQVDKDYTKVNERELLGQLEPVLFPLVS
ncbi:MAG: host attachment protein [Gammaproteobacteria bacterium HGW-Gammaproteobacteria-1]|jgi:protein required for attachment to host cells|nr:MAG: host attachment protein [Gammaproteobacteria bacterium HGW-Gammaproteobacteria-1]